MRINRWKPVFKSTMILAASIWCLSVPGAARAAIRTITGGLTLSVTLDEDQTSPCNCSTGTNTFTSVLDQITLTAPSTRIVGLVLQQSPTHAFPSSFFLKVDTSASPLQMGQWQYRPDVNYNSTCGPDSFTFVVVSDQETATFTMNITVRAKNDVPVASNQTVSTHFNAAKAITLSATDADNTDCNTAVNDVLTFRVTGNPAFGQLTGTGATVTYTPNGTFAGDDTFTFVSNDGHVDSAPATVTVHVVPGLSVSNLSVTEGQTVPLTFTLFPPFSTTRADRKTVTVQWHTVEGTAFGGLCPGQVPFVDDFCDAGSIAGFPVTFVPGVSSQGGNVSTIGDFCREGNETFTVVLTNPTNAFLLNSTATITVRNDDPICTDIFGNDISCTGFCSAGFGKGIPEYPTTEVGERINYGIQWTVPDPRNWHSLATIDVRLVDKEGEIIRVHWDEATNTFSQLQSGKATVLKSALPGDKVKFEGSAVTMFLQTSSVIGSGPTGPSVVLDLSFSFKPQAAGRTFEVQTLATDDSGRQQGFDPIGAISVQPK